MLPVFLVAIWVTTVDAAVYVNALGMGVASRSISSRFYTKNFGIKKGTTMPVANMGQGGWTEDIDTFPAAAHSSALVLMEWTDKRNFKNLPIKLTFAVENPSEKQKAIASSGGKALDMKTEANPNAVYASDPDGYTLELIEGQGTPALKSIGIGVSNLNQSAAWWASATGMTAGTLTTSKEWDTISLNFGKASALTLIDWHETPKRPTRNMPIKVVLAASSTTELTRSIQKQNPKGSQAGSIGMFQWEPLEHTLIEINPAAR